MRDILFWQISDFDKIFKHALSDNGGNPVARIECLWRHCEERKPKEREILAGSNQIGEITS